MWSIEELLKMIKSEVKAREMSEGIKISDSKKTDTPRKGTLPTTSAFVTGFAKRGLTHTSYLPTLTIHNI